MKRIISLWLGVLALALVPALAQTPAPTGKVHGNVINPTGAPQQGGTVVLIATTRAASGPGLKAQTAEAGSFPVGNDGTFSGTAPAAIYRAVYRSPGMANDKEADQIEKVEVKAGEDLAINFDMSRKEYIDQLPPEQKKQLEDLRNKNATAMKANEVIKNLNSDLHVTEVDLKDADTARAAAQAALGASASKADLDAKEAEIKQAKYGEVETIMLKDTAAKPDASVLWARLGQAQVGLKKYDEAEATFKKAIDLEATSKKPNPAIQGLANSELGEVYARTGKIDLASAAYDAAGKAFPPQASFYLRNAAVIYFQIGNTDAQLAAAEKAIAADPTQPLIYYLKGNALVGKATLDDKTHKLVAPAGCIEAYQKYLELAPTGTYAAEVKAIIAQFNQVIDSGFKDDTGKKKKK